MLNGRVAGWTERGNSVLHELTCAQLVDSVRTENVQLQQPFDVTGTWISTRYDINAGSNSPLTLASSFVFYLAVFYLFEPPAIV